MRPQFLQPSPHPTIQQRPIAYTSAVIQGHEVRTQGLVFGDNYRFLASFGEADARIEVWS